MRVVQSRLVQSLHRAAVLPGVSARHVLVRRGRCNLKRVHAVPTGFFLPDGRGAAGSLSKEPLLSRASSPPDLLPCAQECRAGQDRLQSNCWVLCVDSCLRPARSRCRPHHIQNTQALLDEASRDRRAKRHSHCKVRTGLRRLLSEPRSCAALRCRRLARKCARGSVHEPPGAALGLAPFIGRKRKQNKKTSKRPIAIAIADVSLSLMDAHGLSIDPSTRAWSYINKRRSWSAGALMWRSWLSSGSLVGTFMHDNEAGFKHPARR